MSHGHVSRLSDRPVQRSIRLLLGLALFSLSLALLVKADLGLDPWNVFGQGLSRTTGLSLGQVTVVVSVALLVLWVPLRQRPGLGTVANALLVGPMLDLALAVLAAPERLAVRILLLVLAVVGAAVATGLSVGAGWGPGPRDGLMTGLAARGIPVFVGRTASEATVLAVGWLLGGSVGVATVAFAAAIGPLVGFALPRLAVDRPPTGAA